MRARCCVVVAVLALVAGCSGRPSEPVSRVETPAPEPVTSSLQAAPDESAPVDGAAVPVRVEVPRLHIDSRLDRLGLNGSGELKTPGSFERAAWFDGGVRPGDIGPAVIVGHVDSRRGPAVFFALKRAHAGDHVRVTDAGGRTRTFTVTGTHRYPKTSFRTAAVYGPTVQPQLRLITCTGSFDTAERSYSDNLVVFADIARPRAG